MIAGVIQDATGAALVDVSLTAVEEETGFRRSAMSNGEGVYYLPALAPGVYKVTARKVGFRTVARVNVAAVEGDAVRVDFVLPVGSIREVITVEGAPEMVNASDGSVGTTIGKILIDGLPLNGRGVLSLTDLSPGILATPASAGEAGQFSANGQRANANYFTVDGVSANTGVSGSAVPAQFAGGSLPGMTAFGSTQNLVSLEALLEVRLDTSSFAPEFGRMPGAQVAMSTRTGSDEFHGSVFHSFRHERLNAIDRLASDFGLPGAQHRLYHWGAALGGPVRRNRTFFHASHEGLRLRQPYAWRTVTPSLEARRTASATERPLLEAFPLPNGRDFGEHASELVAVHSRPARLDSGSLRIDHALNGNVNLFGRYNQAPSSSEFGLSQVDRSGFGSRSVTVGATALFGAGMTSDLRVNVSGASVESRWVPGAAGGARPVDLRRYLPPVGGYRSALYGLAIGGVGQLLDGESGLNRQGQWNLVETFAINRGEHAVKFGADYQRLTPERQASALAVAGSYKTVADVVSGAPMLTTYSLAEQASSLVETLSLFVQDTWKVSQKLTLTYGMRWELTPAPAMRQAAKPVVTELWTEVTPLPGPAPNSLMPDAGALWPMRYTQFAPRAGAAYRLPGGSVLRAGWGVFYDLGFSAATDPINGFPYNRWQFSARGPVSMSVETWGYRFARELRIPHVHEWNVALERAIGGSNVLTASYVGSAGRNLLRREGRMHPDNGIAELVVATNHGVSDYHALQAQYRRRMSAGLQGVVSYTWSHAIDNGSWDSALALVQPGLSAASDRGSSSFDVRHSLTAALSYTPAGIGRGVLGSVTRGWALHGMLRARTGFPIDILTRENHLGLGFDNVTRPDLNPGVPLWIREPNVFGGRALNPAAFSTPSSVQGNLGRNAVEGFGMSQFDLALAREFSLGDSRRVEFRADAFNLLNHANPGDPVRYLLHPFFGQPASMLNLMLGSGTPRTGVTPAFQSGGPRSLQATLRFRF